jgi:hypothetical protein
MPEALHRLKHRVRRYTHLDCMKFPKIRKLRNPPAKIKALYNSIQNLSGVFKMDHILLIIDFAMLVVYVIIYVINCDIITSLLTRILGTTNHFYRVLH